jgi:serine/threonine protein kinase
MSTTAEPQFVLGEPLGVGTVGSVYRAVLTPSGRAIAVKVLMPSVSDDESIAARFEREMLILEKLDHPNIVGYYGGGKSGGQLFYGMELVDGGSIKQLLEENGLLPWRVAVKHAAHVASALQHAHNHGIIHRDLKPSNLFLDREGEIKLGDFGIALDTHAADLTADGITVGTYGYMSPEQIRSGGAVTGQSDLYSLGCVLFEMLTGEPPYPGKNFAEIWEQHLHSPPPVPSEHGADCPEWLDKLVVQLLAKNPDERPFNARQVQGVLLQESGLSADHDDVAGGQVVDGVATNRQRADASPKPVLGWVLLTAFVATIAGALYWIVQQGG